MNRTSVFGSETSVFSGDCLRKITGGTSKGNQPKWYEPRAQLLIKSQFQYQNKLWKDNLVEIIASNIAYQLGINSVKYDLCQIKTDTQIMDGCFSASFLTTDEVFITYEQLFEQYAFTRTVMPSYRLSAKEHLEQILDVYSVVAELDASVYLLGMTALDWLVGNEDRHENNYGAIRNSDGNYRLAPIFDSGLGLFEHDLKYAGLPLEIAMRRMRSKLLCPKHSKAYANVAEVTGLEISGFLDLGGMVFPNSISREYILQAATSMGVSIL